MNEQRKYCVEYVNYLGQTCRDIHNNHGEYPMTLREAEVMAIRLRQGMSVAAIRIVEAD